VEAQEGQRFCKGCGVNLQIVSDALDTGADTLGQLRIDVDSLKRTAKDFAESFKVNMLGISRGSQPVTSELNPKPKEKKMPRPKEWLTYSWQHNVRDGIISILTGLGLGFVLFYLGHSLIASEFLRQLEINGQEIRLEQVLRLIWLFALIPVLKGIGQLVYAAFFAESIDSLTAKFLPGLQARARLDIEPYTPLHEPPSSVTEHTTQMFGPVRSANSVKDAG
jgi:hypothetical protein